MQARQQLPSATTSGRQNTVEASTFTKSTKRHLPSLSPSFCLHKQLYNCTVSKIRKVIFLLFQTSSLNWFTAQMQTHVLAKVTEKCLFFFYVKQP